MKYWSCVISKLPAQAMAIYPLMLFKNKKLLNNQTIIRHEEIHFKQQLELLIVLFYPLYLLNYLINLVVYKNHHKAYFNISFEREAYANDKNPGYLNIRRSYAWLKFIGKVRLS
ncbi:MAG: hypothetical protein EOO92_02600 [Pedobacter sp.]|nr:MAG: hypothetical protein EOO92_02600 [Pedobacter sp.]